MSVLTDRVSPKQHFGLVCDTKLFNTVTFRPASPFVQCYFPEEDWAVGQGYFGGSYSCRAGRHRRGVCVCVCVREGRVSWTIVLRYICAAVCIFKVSFPLLPSGQWRCDPGGGAAAQRFRQVVLADPPARGVHLLRIGFDFRHQEDQLRRAGY